MRVDIKTNSKPQLNLQIYFHDEASYIQQDDTSIPRKYFGTKTKC